MASLRAEMLLREENYNNHFKNGGAGAKMGVNGAQNAQVRGPTLPHVVGWGAGVGVQEGKALTLGASTPLPAASVARLDNLDVCVRLGPCAERGLSHTCCCLFGPLRLSRRP